MVPKKKKIESGYKMAKSLKPTWIGTIGNTFHIPNLIDICLMVNISRFYCSLWLNVSVEAYFKTTQIITPKV